VKQSDFVEYEENAREKQTIHVYKLKAPTPPQTKPYGWETPISKLKRVVTKPWGFSMQKSILPLKLRWITSSPLKPGQIKSSAKLNKRCQLPLK
jgi:hypothetical protein